jgi:hypothetical protein
MKPGMVCVSFQDAGSADIAYVLMKDEVDTWKGRYTGLRVMRGSASEMCGAQRDTALIDTTAADDVQIEKL